MSVGNTVTEVLMAWVVGLTIAGVIYGPITAISQGSGGPGVLQGIVLIPTYLFLSFTIGAMISVPLMALGVLTALFLGVRPAYRPLFWTVLCTIGGTIFYGLGDAMSRGDLLGGGAWPIGRLDPVLLADLTIIAISVFGGTYVYCRRLRARFPAITGNRADR